MTKLLFIFSILTFFSPNVPRAEEMTESSIKTSALSIEMKIGTSLENRELVGESDSFPPETTHLVGWTRVTGSRDATEIKHVWKFNGKEVSTVSLNVTSSPYRTYSRKKVMGSGSYSLEVVDASGELISSKIVTVE